ncbi:MAG: hypothetical protein GY801_27940 [bacterium]|nr:hypothetical protein [bacterium]
MQFEQSQFNELYEALNEAFSTNESLEELARMAHSETLDQIATGTSTKIKIQRMLEKAFEGHWLTDLLQAACKLRPHDEKLLQFSQHAQELSEEFERLNGENQREAVCRFLEEIENRFKTVRLFHGQEIVLKDQYIPIEVTLERRYQHQVESSFGYAEDEVELSRAYALKGRMEEGEKRTQVPWKEARQKNKRIIVLADPGMGKTALLKMEAVTTAQLQRQNILQQTFSFGLDDVIFPLFLRLFDLADKNEEIIEAIPRLIQRDYPTAVLAILPLVEENVLINYLLNSYMIQYDL